MQRVEGGRSTCACEARRSDEIGALSRGFNAMIERLARPTPRFARFNRRLADEVKAATIDLARKNEALGQLNRLLARSAPRARRQRAAGRARSARRAAGARDRHAARLGVGPLAAGASRRATCRRALKERLQVATRELERVSKNRARLSRLDARGGAGARCRSTSRALVDEALGIAHRRRAARRGWRSRSASIPRPRDADHRSRPAAADPGQPVTNAADAVAQHPRGAPRGAGVRARRIASPSRCATTASASRPRTWRASSSRSTPPRGAARAPASAWPSAASWRSRSAAASTVDSAPGRGSTFTVTLPRSERKRS